MAETVYSGSVEPDQARTCVGNKRNNCIVSVVLKQLAVTFRWLRTSEVCVMAQFHFELSITQFS